MEKLSLTWSDVYSRSRRVSEDILKVENTDLIRVYAIPSAGLYAAQAIQGFLFSDMDVHYVESPREADIYIDDVLDSGDTIRRVQAEGGIKPVYVLVDKQKEGIDSWVEFPWDRMKNHAGPEDNIKRILQHIGEDPEREGLKETPSRVVRSYQDLFSGYKYKTDEDIQKLMKIFEDGACNEMVLLKNIEFVSMCEHHMLPFTGKAHIAYLPAGRIVGVSKLARVLEVYARRLQVQERLTQQVTQALDVHLEPKGSACIIEAVHECMTCRGVMKQNSVMVTSSLTGDFRELAVRQELLNLIK